MDSSSEDKLAEVHPELARRVRLLGEKCAANDIWLRVDQGFRTWDQQEQLYAQGRTLPGEIVTNARGGFSMHNFGLAVDIVPGDAKFPKFIPDWDAMDFRWRQVLLLGQTCHLAEGAQWRSVKPDCPHLYPEEVPATPDDNFRYLFREGGLKAVWDEVNLKESA